MDKYTDNGVLIFDTKMSKGLRGSTNYEDEKGLTLFHIACMNNDVNRVKELLDSGANIDCQVHSGKNKGFTALHFAIIYKQKDIVEFLLKKNAKVNIELGASKLTPLHLACEYLHYINFDEEKFMHESRSNQLHIIKLLLLHGAHVDAKDSSGMTPLLHTCMAIRGSRRLVYSFEERDKLREARNKLKEEIGIRLTETIKILISNKANINARTSSGLSVLHIISQCTNLKISEKLVEILVISGVDVNAVTDTGLTPLYIAASRCNIDMVTMLLKHEANPNITSKKSFTPLQAAAKEHGRYAYDQDCGLKFSKCQSIITKLLECGTDINITSYNYDYLFQFEDRCKRSGLGHAGYGKLVYMIFSHVQKLLALKLPVCQRLQNSCNEFHNKYKDQEPDSIYVKELESDFTNSCINELNKMKKIKIDSYTSLYDILLKDPQELANHVKNSTLIKNLENEKDFPIYSYLLQLQFKRGLLRRQIIQTAQEALQNVPGINLPQECCNMIFKYLSNKDISNVKKAALIKCNFKRKLDNNYSNQIEFTTKLKKIRQ